MPGTYLTLNISQFVKYVYPRYDTISSETNFNQVEATIIFAIISIVMGVFVYSIDNPRLLGWIFKSLPSNIIRKKHKNANGIEVLNSYFVFYDSLPDAVKYKTEKQSGFLHLSLNMILVNFISLILLIIAMLVSNPETRIFTAHLTMVIGMIIISYVSAWLIYSKRLKYTYARAVDMYFDSEEYKKLTENLNKK
jgi:hypothetical protein